MGLAVLSGGMAFVGSASATELIVDGSFENTTSVTATVRAGGVANTDPAVGAGWSTFSTYLYSTKYAGFPGPANSGASFLRPYPSGTYGVTRSSDTVVQNVSLTGASGLTTAKIDAGQGLYRLAGWFSGYLDQTDYSDLTLEFFDGIGNAVGDPVPLAGIDFYAAIPQYDNGRYPNARQWVQDTKSGTIPAGARTARVTIHATPVGGGAPDGYVDNVSLDVSDASSTNPAITEAVPANNAIGVGPVVNIALTIQDRVKAVDPSSIQLFLDNVQVTPTTQKLDVNTSVKYSAGLLPALSQHTYKIIFGDNGTPTTKQTNSYSFTVADYLTLPVSLKTPLGSEDVTKPGFNVNVYQVAQLDGNANTDQINTPSSVAFGESVLAGLVGDNIADLTGAAETNRFNVPDVVNWIGLTGVSGNIANDTPFPGIPGTTGVDTSFVEEIRTYIRFPAAGYYQMGVNNDDYFRLTAGTNGVQTLKVNGANGFVIPTVPIATNITKLQFGGALPKTPLTGTVIYATPTGDPETSCDFTGNTALAGKIVLLDLGGTGCNTADKALAAQNAGAIAVIGIYSGNTFYPSLSGDINDQVTIPVLIIAENYGGSQLKTLLGGATAVSVTIQTDTNPRLAEWDAPKQFGAVDVNFGFAVPEAGVYPFRMVAGQESGAASLEWYQIMPDGKPVLINDTSNPNVLRAFRALVHGDPNIAFNVPSFANGKITLSWQGTATLEEATSVAGPWSTAASQTNPQSVDAAGAMKFYRLKQP
ncbi:MAG TPA: PA domain-containing protein [Verrucomicrobiae bacterium]